MEMVLNMIHKAVALQREGTTDVRWSGVAKDPGHLLSEKKANSRMTLGLTLYRGQRGLTNQCLTT